MTQPRTVVVDRDDLEHAFDFVSSAAPLGHQAWISVATGKIRWHSMLVDMADDDDADVADDAEDADDTGGEISVPHVNDLDLGRRLVLRFVGQQLPRDDDTVEDSFRRRGAYARFKDLLQTCRMLERWYEFEKRAKQEALLEWCEENGIQLAEATPGDKRG